MDEQQRNSVGQNLQILPHSLRAQDGDRSIQAPIVYCFERPQAESMTNVALNDLDTSIPSATGASTSTSKEMSDDLDSMQPSVLNIERFLHLSKSSGEIRLLRVWPSDWSLGPLTLVVRATQADNEDRYTLTTLTITTSGIAKSNGNSMTKQQQLQLSNQARGIQFVINKLNYSVAENTPVFEKIGNVKAILIPTTIADSINSTDLSASPNLNESVDLIGSTSNLHFTRATTQSIISSKVATQDSSANSWQRQPRNLHNQQVVADNANKQAAKQRLSGRQVSHTKTQQAQISYQILDDQTDQFGVNQSGEIFLKKPLDYEQRQEFLFRILATHSRYSDICQVQVNVINVNDNKPKVSTKLTIFDPLCWPFSSFKSML